ncbi:DUF393 domain-containing protein [Simiduia curdlanivorans]|uniref:Thiol-disulfide oxidoreductase DCC family protein n=1 Tax=Simiduia curdlanivorans TaxID=1492769 RepID=A0ABV8VC35_9GAMM|nr:DUF393 domain-containing protein [Simiduia curdlanivorans]MDN3639385.1 DUF393 domain-containing protein [Simiduia curdlanivorans]
MSALTIFYDSRCPLCVKEMLSLQRRNSGQLGFEDIFQPDFSVRFPHINPERANAVLHGQTRDGELLLGLDVTAHAWALVGNPLFKVLRRPLIKPIADLAYEFFARHRYRISYLLTGQARCKACVDIKRVAP